MYNSNQEMKTYTIRLQKYDDLLTIQDKITWSTTARIILVFPERSRIVTRRLDFERISRFAGQKGFHICAVIRDDEMGEEANKAGLVVFKTIDDAQKRVWKKSYSPKFESKKRYGSGEILHYFKNLNQNKQPVNHSKQLLLAAGLIMLGLISLLVFFVPGAEIRIRPDRQEQIKTVIVAASPKFASMAEGVLIPAQIETLAVTANGTLNTTGETGIPSDFARGEVELVNLSTDRIVIPAGTVVTASSDPTKRYQILNEITVDSANPAGVTTEIKASAPGATYNVPAGVINTIEAQFGLNVKVNNHLAIDGGKDLKIKSASQADYDQLKHNLMDELSQKAARGIEAKLQSGEVLTGSMVNLKQIIKEEASTQIGQPADSINLTVEAVFEGWIIKQNKLEEMAAAALLSDIPVGYEAVPGTLNVESLDKPVLSDHDLTWKVKAQQETRRHFELSQIQLEAAGKPVTQAAAELQNRYHLGKPPDIRVFPPVWPMMPLYFMRIDAVVE